MIQFVVGARDAVNKVAICIMLCDIIDGGMVRFDVQNIGVGLKE